MFKLCLTHKFENQIIVDIQFRETFAFVVTVTRIATAVDTHSLHFHVVDLETQLLVSSRLLKAEMHHEWWWEQQWFGRLQNSWWINHKLYLSELYGHVYEYDVLTDTITTYSQTYKGHVGQVLRDHSIIWYQGRDITLAAWNAALPQVRIHDRRGEVTSVTLSFDEHYVISTSTGSVVNIWDRETGVCLRRFKQHHKAVSTAVVNPANQHIISYCRQANELFEWRLDNLKIYCKLMPSQPLFHMSIYPDPRYLLVAAESNSWDNWEFQILDWHNGQVIDRWNLPNFNLFGFRVSNGYIGISNYEAGQLVIVRLETI